MLSCSFARVTGDHKSEVGMRKMKRMRSVPVIEVIAVIALGVYSAQGSSGAWTGANSAAWTNNANWSSSTYPGSGTGQTATFNSAGNGNTVLDLLGLASIKYMTFASTGVAAYTVGTGGTNSQTLTLEKNIGRILLAGDAANSQIFNAVVRLGSDAATGDYTFQNDSTAHTLTFAGDVAGAASGGTPGTKTLNVYGAGDMLISGSISDGGANPVKLASYGTGALVLAGVNSYNGDTELYDSGSLILKHPKAMGGAGSVLIRSVAPGAVVELAHDGAGETPFKIGMGIGFAGTIISGVGTGSVGINHTVSELNLSHVTLNVERSAAVSSGSPSITAQSLVMNGGGSYTTILNPTTADLILGNVTISSGSYRKNLVLGGTSAGNRVEGVISNGLTTVSVEKSNSGTWTLAGANVYTGTTTVTDGKLVLSGANGTIKNSVGITLSGGTLVLDNTSVSGLDRLGNAEPVTLAGGTLEFAHAAGASDYSEKTGALIVSAGSSAVVSARAADGQSSAMTFDSLVYTGGTIDFVGTNLGVDARNQILFTTPPTLSGGQIGTWATVNGTNFATYGTYGITAYTPAYTDIAARGPGSTIPDSADSHVRIVSDGVAGAIDLAGTGTNRIATLQQTNADIPATVNTASKTLLTSSLAISPGAAALTIGASVNSGALAALSAEGVLSLVNGTANTQTINAVVADNTTASIINKSGSGPVVLNGTYSHTGPLVISEGALVFGGHDVPQSVASVVGGAGALVKTGTNLLHLLGANTLSGPVTVHEGKVRPNQNTAFGSAAGGVFIADGAAIDIGCTPDVGGTRIKDNLNLGAELFSVCGAGADGKGVIVNNSTGSQNSAFGKITLTGNATFGGTADWRLRNNTPTLNLNDFILTKAGANMIDLYGATVIPGSGHVNVAEGIFRILYDVDMGGSGSNTITVQSGAELNLYRVANPQGWKMIMENGSTFEAGSSDDALQNRWAGPVVLNGTVSLTGISPYIADIQGLISGVGSITKSGGSLITLSGTDNTYTGATRITAGRLIVKSLRKVGEPCSLGQPTTAAAGAIVIGTGTTTGSSLEYIGAGDTTDRVITMGGTTGGVTIYHNGTGPLKFTRDLDAAAAGAKNLVFRGDSKASGEFAGNIADVGGSVIAVGKYDAGSWTLSGTNTYTGALTVDSGTLFLSGSNGLANTVTINTGNLLLSGSLSQGAFICEVKGSTSGNGTLKMTSGSTLTGTGNLRVGTENNSHGALYLEDGSLIRSTTVNDGDGLTFGYNAGGYGYMKMSGGVLTCPRLQLGHTSGLTPSYGIVRMTGGIYATAHTVHISRNTNSVGVVTIEGGTLTHTNASTFIQMGYRGGRGELNLTGGNFLNDGQTIQVRYSSGNSTGIVNLCAGTLSLDAFLNNSTGTAWLNFRGGTLKASADSSAFIPSSMTGVFCYGPFGSYAGGAVFDTAGRNVTVAEPVQAPGGNGVYAISLSNQGAGYIGEPYVSITGGGGFGATAVANMVDDGSGYGTYKVASVSITSPGCGYIGTPTVMLQRGGNGIVTSSVASVTLAPNTSGGLTKLGAGTLTLSAANTYTGVTTIAGGTLKLTNAKALLTQTQVVLAGGTLDLNGYAITNALGGSGVVTNGTVQAWLSPAGENVIGTNTLTLASATLQGTYLADVTASGGCDRVAIQGDLNLSGLTVQLVAPGQLNRHYQYTLLTCSGIRSGTLTVTNLPDSRWRLIYLADGTVKLVFIDGMMIKIR